MTDKSNKYIKKLSKKNLQKKFNKKVFEEYVKIGDRDAAVAFSEDVKKGKAPPSIIGEASTIAKEWGTKEGADRQAKKAVKNVKLKNKKFYGYSWGKHK